MAFILNITYQKENYKPFNAGHDIDDQDLFICRTYKFGQIIPGKYSHNIGKCSIARNQKEMQFNQFELLIEGSDAKYEWVKLKKPVTKLPDNVLFGGTQQTKTETKSNHKIQQKHHKNSLYHMLSDDLLNYKIKKRRFRRSTKDNWSRNWRGVINGPNKFNKFITEIPLPDCWNPSYIISTNFNNDNKCREEKHKLNYFIAKCSLRTGDKISEQIGKIWWKNNIQEWIASFAFGGHEIYCLDYSVLTLKTN